MGEKWTKMIATSFCALLQLQYSAEMHLSAKRWHGSERPNLLISMQKPCYVGSCNLGHCRLCHTEQWWGTSWSYLLRSNSKTIRSVTYQLVLKPVPSVLKEPRIWPVRRQNTSNWNGLHKIRINCIKSWIIQQCFRLWSSAVWHHIVW
jgi:hypothetical protein